MPRRGKGHFDRTCGANDTPGWTLGLIHGRLNRNPGNLRVGTDEVQEQILASGGKGVHLQQ